jgi:hypothetical protein
MGISAMGCGFKLGHGCVLTNQASVMKDQNQLAAMFTTTSRVKTDVKTISNQMKTESAS